jgi:hypothetical protein
LFSQSNRVPRRLGEMLIRFCALLNLYILTFFLAALPIVSEGKLSSAFNQFYAPEGGFFIARSR